MIMFLTSAAEGAQAKSVWTDLGCKFWRTGGSWSKQIPSKVNQESDSAISDVHFILQNEACIMLMKWSVSNLWSKIGCGFTILYQQW